ncbi:hypothetical protein [Xanthobacter agilis]|jgi:vacuolar-type H+-ATPase subunit I/STV1|uniref:Vacuolar-type H+-ATPase subunit I/STV1 n=1 Tax=Xanthobacter agilis TaxID=47492 RepID=A0ABU0LEL9_XANAG|nr:hypothetical protein [Xanthobacter agilis]MDQ0505580.1 vacuolar-type H+-ATPase subunit I/STV1 [Xanthobacter agilis]
MSTAPRSELQTLQKLDQLCRQIARGNYDYTDELFALTCAEDASPSIRELAESFGFMLVQVEARETRLTWLVEELQELKAQLEEANGRLRKENATLSDTVAQLTVAIDRQRFKREVGAITESDYFQNLQRRARSLRERHKAGEPEDRK